MKIIRNRSIQEGTLLLAICGWLTWYCLNGYGNSFDKDWTQSPFLFPIVMGGLLGLLGIMLVAQGIRALAVEQKESDRAKDGLLRVCGLAVLCLVYYLALVWIKLPYLALNAGAITLQFSTFELSTLIFTACMMLYMGVRKPLVLALTPIGATVFLSVIFRSLLHVILP